MMVTVISELRMVFTDNVLGIAGFICRTFLNYVYFGSIFSYVYRVFLCTPYVRSLLWQGVV